MERQSVVKARTELEEDFFDILEHRLIYPVYQPIVSLKTGFVFGYEALSRIRSEQTNLNVSQLFELAEEHGKVWELEALCRGESLKYARKKPVGTKLFLNVDPNVIHDEKFKSGLTYEYLNRYGLKPEDIIFEITERSSIGEIETFQKTIDHYKAQNFKIAIDDFGEGYAGLNRIFAVLPNFIKIDMEIVRGIDKNELKQSLVKSIQSLCQDINVIMIAEGIETLEELRELIRLGVPYGQGYFLQMPTIQMGGIEKEKSRMILNLQAEQSPFYDATSIFGNIGSICKKREVKDAKTSAYDLFQLVSEHSEITEICIVDKEGHALGLCTKTSLYQQFGGMYGFNLSKKRIAIDVMSTDCLVVEVNTSVEMVAQMALARPNEQIYDAVVVIQNGKYFGVVTVKDLLETVIEIQVQRAAGANPLTGLPGNRAIETSIFEHIIRPNPYTIMYLDLDNFKAYNDVYGFNMGDLMIKEIAECMKSCCKKNEFIGHIGGDDFVIICDHWEGEMLCAQIIQKFDERSKHLYHKCDLQNNYIVSKNRKGVLETFPLVSLSIAAITNQEKCFCDLDAFSVEIAKLKKSCKESRGSCYQII